MPAWGWLLVWLALLVGFLFGHASGRGMAETKGRRAE